MCPAYVTAPLGSGRDTAPLGAAVASQQAYSTACGGSAPSWRRLAGLKVAVGA